MKWFNREEPIPSNQMEWNLRQLQWNSEVMALLIHLVERMDGLERESR